MTLDLLESRSRVGRVPGRAADSSETLPGFRLVVTMTDDDGWERRVGASTRGCCATTWVRSSNPFTYLVAGPPPMVEASRGELGEAGVPEEQVLPSRFSGY